MQRSHMDLITLWIPYEKVASFYSARFILETRFFSQLVRFILDHCGIFPTLLFSLNSISVSNQCWVVESLDLLEIIPTRWEWTWHPCSHFCTRELSVTWFVANSLITLTFGLNSITPINISGTCLFNTFQRCATKVLSSGSANNE